MSNEYESFFSWKQCCHPPWGWVKICIWIWYYNYNLYFGTGFGVVFFFCFFVVPREKKIHLADKRKLKGKWKLLSGKLEWFIFICSCEFIKYCIFKYFPLFIYSLLFLCAIFKSPSLIPGSASHLPLCDRSIIQHLKHILSFGLWQVISGLLLPPSWPPFKNFVDVPLPLKTPNISQINHKKHKFSHHLIQFWLFAFNCRIGGKNNMFQLSFHCTACRPVAIKMNYWET